MILLERSIGIPIWGKRRSKMRPDENIICEAPPNMAVVNAHVTRDGEILFTTMTTDERGNPYTVADIERAAKSCPAHDWRLVTGDREYRRHNGRWMCIN
jgi:hypothetical protein